MMIGKAFKMILDQPLPAHRFEIGAVLLLLGVLLAVAGCSSTPKADAKSATAQKYAFWPPYPDEPRIQFLISLENSGQIAERKSNALADIVYGKESLQDVAINKPYGVEMWNGRIYTCDIRAGVVMVFDLRQKQTRVMGSTGSEVLARPTDIAIADDGMKYVSDIGRNLIFVFDAKERFITTYGMKDFQPTGIAVFGDRLYVGNFLGHCIEIFSRTTGEHLGHIGEQGNEDGMFVRPLGVAVDGQGNVYVTDVIRCKLQKFSPDGQFLFGFGTITNNIGSFVRPKHMAVDHDGLMYITDASFQNVQIFSPEGDILTFFGAVGTHPGSMYLPAGITVHYGDLDIFKPYIHPDFEADYLIIVTNQFTENKVSVYAFGQLRAGVTVADIRASQTEIKLGVEDANKVGGQGIGGEVEPDAVPSDLKN